MFINNKVPPSAPKAAIFLANRSLVPLAALAWLALSHGAQADAFDPLRIKCNASELAALQDAVAKAKTLATGASAVLPPVESTGGARFQKWFGGPEGDYDPVIKTVYDEMGVNIIFQRYWCLPPNSQTPDDLFHTNAFIVRGSVGEIFVTSNFFLLATTGPKSQGGTIVHEAAHQSAHRKIVDDGSYGPEAAKQRATTSADQARANSDNYKYFAEDVAYGVP